MRTRLLLTPVLIVALCLVCLAPPAAAQQKYAILISGGAATVDDAMYHSEYWYDLFIMYRMLIDRGYTHNNIFVLYGNGADFASAHAAYQTGAAFPGVAQITDFPNAKANINNIFTWLAAGNPAQGVPQIQPGDTLFYWWMGHGNWDGDDASGNHLYHASIQNTAEQVTDAEFSANFAQLPACVIKTAFVMTCHSGALFDAFPGLHLAAHTAARYDQTSHSSILEGHPHADFTFYAASALRELTPGGAAVASDANGDGQLSIGEANAYTHAHTLSSETVVFDFRNIAPRIVLGNAQPAAIVPTQFVYSRDYATDDGTVPSDYAHNVWYEGPDLWVRQTNDGLTGHQNPEFGQPNYVYAKVHNIGCAPLNATAALSWSEQSAWMNPAAWTPIGTVALGGLASGETRVVSALWDSVPMPGKYCLHTTLDAVGDPANADGRSFMDNNKVQINVTVENTVWGWVKKHYWWLENGGKEMAVVDLVITKPGFGAGALSPKIQLQLPPDLAFSRVTGAKVVETKQGRLLEVLPRSRRVVVHDIPLGPLEKREAVLAVTLPRSLGRANSVSILVAEHVRGQEMGGIVFHTRIAPQRQVLAQSIRQLENFSRSLATASRSEAAGKLAALCSTSHETAPKDTRAFTAFMGKVGEIEPGLRADLGKLLTGQDAAAMNASLDELVAAVKTRSPGRFVTAQEAVFNSSKAYFRKQSRK